MNRKLSCPGCEKEIFYKDINIEKAIAKCSNCHTVFSFEEEELSGPPKRPGDIRLKEEIFIIPKGIEMYTILSELNIEMTWRHTGSKFILTFGLFWNAILLPFIFIAIFAGEPMIFLFISAHLAVGIGFGYACLSILFNKTYISADEYGLRITHSPFTWFHKQHDIPADQIKQLFVKKYTNGSTNGQPNYAYSLNIILKNGEEIKLMKGINKPIPARYLEQEIEKFMNIKDARVAEEY